MEMQIVSGVLRNANLLIKVGNRFCGKFGVTQQQWVLLESLAKEKDGLKLSDVGQNLLVTKSNITGLIDRLERDGFVERVVTKDDRRVLLARITEKGLATLQKIRKAEREWDSKCFAGFTPGDKETMIALNQRLYDFLHPDVYKEAE